MFASVLLLCLVSFGVSYGSCPIESYSSTGCFASGSALVNIDRSFRSSMNSICAAAISCRVKLYITDSYRRPDSPVLNPIVQPAQLSNHKIGHAIDMNVVYGTSNTLCNSRCLGGTQPAAVKCFIDAVKTARLRWGGNFAITDPVHIDDGYNSNVTAYRSLYAKIQRDCA